MNSFAPMSNSRLQRLHVSVVPMPETMPQAMLPAKLEPMPGHWRVACTWLGSQARADEGLKRLATASVTDSPAAAATLAPRGRTPRAGASPGPAPAPEIAPD